jgi:hypothetical protein
VGFCESLPVGSYQFCNGGQHGTFAYRRKKSQPGGTYRRETASRSAFVGRAAPSRVVARYGGSKDAIVSIIAGRSARVGRDGQGVQVGQGRGSRGRRELLLLHVAHFSRVFSGTRAKESKRKTTGARVNRQEADESTRCNVVAGSSCKLSTRGCGEDRSTGVTGGG